MFAKKKFIIGGIVIVCALAYLAFVSYSDSATYYFTVSELSAEGRGIIGDTIRVNGWVAKDSIEEAGEDLTISFTISEGGDDLHVVYSGIVPDAFRDERDVVVEGQLEDGGMFRANTILTKCPSKYVPEEEDTSGH